MRTTEDLRVLRLSDGRRLAWCERGDPAGAAVFAFHGLPGSRLQAHPDDSIAVRAGARVIHVDRPGFGCSDLQRHRRLRDWAADIDKLADHLQLDRFSVVGVSGGGPFACGCAALLGARITRAAIVSGVGLPGTMSKATSALVRFGFWAAPWIPQWMVAAPTAVAARVAVHAPGFFLDRILLRLPECDREILRKLEIRAMLLEDVAEAFRSGYQGFLQDLRIGARPWDISLEAVSCPVRLWHGDEDTIVPPSASQALAARIPGATVSLFPRAGHFFVYAIWGEILDWLVCGRGPT